MQQFSRVAFVFAISLSGCPIGGGGNDDVGDGESASETTSGETGSTTSSSSTDGSSTDGSSTDGSTSTDESTSTDGSSTDESTSTDESSTDTGEGETGNPDCLLNDGWEPNPSAAQASMMTWQAVSAYSAYRIFDAYLCPGEGDWYQFDVESLGYTEHYFYLRALVEDAGLCGLACGDVVIPPGPDNAMTIEVYRADNMQLLLSTTQDDGVLPLGGFGDDFAHQLLIHVSSPTPEAEYPYHLTVEVRNYEGEDECEC